MASYRLMSTHHNVDGSVEPPSATLGLTASDDAEAIETARNVPPDCFAEDADFAWLVDEAGRVVASFPLAFGRAA